MLGDQVDDVVQRREHAEPKQVELHQTDCRAVVFVPLQDAAVLHSGPLHRAHVGDRPIADHHAAGMDAHVPRQVVDLHGQVDHRFRDVLDVRGVGQPVPPADLLAPRVLLPLREPQRAGHVAHRAAAAVGDHVGDLCGVVTAVTLVDVLNRVLAQVGFDVDVDVRRPVARRGQEPLEQQLVGDRVDVGDAERVADRRVGRRAATLGQDVVVPAEPGDVVHHQEVARKGQLLNDFQLMLDLRVRPWRPLRRTVAVAGALHDQIPQPAVLGVPVRDVERRQLRGDQRQPERALLAEVGRGRHHLGAMCEQPRHLLPRPQVRTAQRRKETGRLVHRVAGPDGAHRHGQLTPRRFGEVGGGGRDETQPELRRKLGQRGVALVVERMAVMGQLDADPVGAEPVHQVGQRGGGRLLAAL